MPAACIELQLLLHWLASGGVCPRGGKERSPPGHSLRQAISIEAAAKKSMLKHSIMHKQIINVYK